MCIRDRLKGANSRPNECSNSTCLGAASAALNEANTRISRLDRLLRRHLFGNRAFTPTPSVAPEHKRRQGRAIRRKQWTQNDSGLRKDHPNVIYGVSAVRILCLYGETPLRPAPVLRLVLVNLNRSVPGRETQGRRRPTCRPVRRVVSSRRRPRRMFSSRGFRGVFSRY